ncbi:MAG: hypothetical protein JW768_04620 [Chitinispirillaceae bacterium]|nr:hypothetical protein [Chitinispirillaceae bacterium]
MIIRKNCSGILLYMVLFFWLVLACSCASVRHVRPIETGELTASASFGGPFAGQIGWAPFPLLGIGANYGIMDNIDVETGWAVTSALFGVCELEGGCNWRPLKPAGGIPGIIASVKLLGTTDFQKGNSRLWPDAGITALWQLHPRLYYYAGMDNWFETHTTRYDGNKQKYHWLPIIHTGLDCGSPAWQWQIEAKWYVPNIDPLKSPSNPVQTITIGGCGCFGMFVGVSHSFGKMGRAGKGGDH